MKMISCLMRMQRCRRLLTVWKTPDVLLGRQLTSGETCPGSVPRGLVLGVYSSSGENSPGGGGGGEFSAGGGEFSSAGGGAPLKLTASAQSYDEQLQGRLSELLKAVQPLPSLGQVRTLYALDDSFTAVAVVGLGPDCAGYEPREEMDEQKEAVRIAGAAGCRALQELRLSKIYLESLGHTESAAEGALMGVWIYQTNRSECSRIPIPKIELFDSCDWIGWKIGQEKAAAQNLARQLTETPANQLTPTVFALSVQEVLSKASVDVVVRTRKWAEHRKLNSFLSVSSGSCQQPILLEVSYEGCDPDVAPIILIGKGVTFDAGGLCLKARPEMADARGSMGGAAAVVSAVRAIATLQIPINVRGLLPLCENLPGPCAFKPGDVITAYNGKTILVSDSRSDGQLVLADALAYSSCYRPKFVVDVACLSPDVSGLLGSSASAIFSNSEQLYSLMRIASLHTGDRLVRLPLSAYYAEGVEDCLKADCRSVAKDGVGSCCAGAAFLWAFAPRDAAWLHIDTAGVQRTSVFLVTETMTETETQTTWRGKHPLDGRIVCGPRDLSAELVYMSSQLEDSGTGPIQDASCQIQMRR